MKEDAYAAGLFDGEGTVTLSKRERKALFRHPVLSMTSTTYVLVLFMQRQFGGHISTHTQKNEKHSMAWSWKVSHVAALRAAKRLYRLLKEPEKIRRMRLLINKFESVTVRNGKYTDEQLKKKLQFEHDFFHPS